MSLFDDASLVYIPTGYKATKNYSGKPSTGGADMTFSRASGATRVNSKGLVEKVRTNLLTYSEDFSTSAGWSASGSVSATANYGTAPNGTNTSTQIVFTGGSQIWRKTVSGINGNLGVFSLWIKGVAGETIVVTYGGTDKVLTLTGNWTRFYTNGNIASSAELFINTFASVTARTIEVWGGQVEYGTVATNYIETTSAAVSVGPVNDEPRLTYNPVNPTAPSLLMEPQRTNALAYSEYLNGILSSAGTVTDNATTSPQGVINAGLFTENTATAYHRFNAGSQTYTSGQSYTFSVFAKSKSGNRYLIINCLSAFNGRAFFDIDNGTFTTNSGTATIEDYGNGWYRCIVTGTATATKADSIYWGLNATETDSSYTGDGTSGMYIWGAQLENSSSYPTSYIPTNGTSVTRVADASSKTGISDLIGQTEGTLFLDFVWNGLGTASVDNPMFSIGLQEYGTSNISIANYNGALYGRVTVGVNIEANIAFGAMIAGTRYKAALAYANNDVTFYVNGLSYGSDTSASIPEISSAYLQNAYPNAKSVNKVLLFPTRLDDTTLATLTSL